MNNALRSLIFVAILGSFGNYCVAAQAAQPLQVKNLKIRNGELRSRFEALQALPLAEQDQAAIKTIKDDSNAYLQEAQSKTNSNTKRLVEELNTEIMKQWPEPKKPGLFSRAGGWLKSAAASTAQKTKDLAGSGLATLGNGVKSTASKAASKLQYHLFEEGEITRAEIELETRRKNLADQEHPSAQEIEQLRQDVDALQKRATSWYGQLHMPIEELRVRAQSLAIPAPRTRVLQTQENVRELIQQDIFTVGQAPAAPALHQPKQPRALEVTPLTPEEQKKQADDIIAQAMHEKESTKTTEATQQATTLSPSSTSAFSSSSVGSSSSTMPAAQTTTSVPSGKPTKASTSSATDFYRKQETVIDLSTASVSTSTTAAPVVAPVQAPAQSQALAERSEALLKHLRHLQESDPHQQRKELHDEIIKHLEDHPTLLNEVTQCIYANRDHSYAEIHKALDENKAYQAFEQNILSCHAGNPSLNAVRQEFIYAAIYSQKNLVRAQPVRQTSNWLLTGIGATAAMYGSYGLYNLYAGTTKTMVGYKGMSLLGSALPKAWSFTKAATFKVILPAVGIAAAGLICYACYRFYVHKKLSDATAEAKARCTADNRTPQDREALLRVEQKHQKESLQTAADMITVAGGVEAFTGTNPLTDNTQNVLAEKAEQAVDAARTAVKAKINSTDAAQAANNSKEIARVVVEALTQTH